MITNNILPLLEVFVSNDVIKLQEKNEFLKIEVVEGNFRRP